ncbi:unnamed protein product [Cuscuta epithymum]|uniref:Large ribosomal subunit protein uL4c n=1 Tax=Cuscuta epithymum TaxID=186058 RepID=A0AAV0FSJ8_9ASTE|nr:unnamed protein product [Cuscuta epithymum]
MAISSTSSFSSSVFISTPLPKAPSKLKFMKFPKLKVSRFASVRAELATLPVLSFDGDQVGSATLDLKTAPPHTARAVVHRGITTDLRNKRRGTASTLTRGEVRGGGKKPYQQKKTGKARRGSQRTPLRPGGGVIFGPKPKDWSIKINKKEKRLAISTALSSAAKNSIVVEEFNDKFQTPKTKEFIAMMKRLGLDPKEKSMFLMTEMSDNVMLSSRNLGKLKMLTPRTMNLFDILDSEKLVFTKSAVEFLNQRYGNDNNWENDTEFDEEDDVEDEEGSETDENPDTLE